MIATCLILIAVSIVQIKKVNQGLPAVCVVNTYTKDYPAEENGVRMTPVNVHVYTVEEYNAIFGEKSEFISFSEEQLSKMKNWKMAVFTICYENTTDDTKIYSPYQFNAYGRKSHWNNGVSEISRLAKMSIPPRQKQTVTLVSPIVEKSIIRSAWFERTEQDQYSLIYEFYPERKELIFDYE